MGEEGVAARVDAEWYRLAYPDVAAARLRPAKHFARFGEAEGRAPSPWFDPAAYLAANPDVAAAGERAFTHWRDRGRTEGRRAWAWVRGPGAPLDPAELGRRLAGEPVARQRALLRYHHPRLLRLGARPDELVRTLVALGSGDEVEPLLRGLLERAVEERSLAAPRVRVLVGSGDEVAVLVTVLGCLADPASAEFELAPLTPPAPRAGTALPEVHLPAGSWPAPGLVDRLVDDERRLARDARAIVAAVPLERLREPDPPTARRDPDIAELVQLVGPVPAGPERTALVVEATIPTPDRDSGSMCTMQYARALARLGYGVDVVTLHDQGADEHRRALEREEFRFRGEPGAAYDVALVMRAGGFRAIGPRLRGRVRTLAYVAVDLHHLRVAAQAEVVGDPQITALAEELAAVELANTDLADLTLVNSVSELDYLRGVVLPGTRVAHMPMARPVPAYRIADDDRDDELVFFGGFLHEPNLDAVTWFLDEIWPTVSSELPQAQVGVYGADLPASLAARTDERVRFHGHVPRVEDAFARARVSVVPLRFGAGVKGKVVSSLVNGVAVVSTPVGVQGLDLPDDAVTVAADASSFARAVVRLYSDRDLRERQRRRGYDVARERFTLDALVARLGEELGAGDPRSVDPVAGLGPKEAEQVGERGHLGR